MKKNRLILFNILFIMFWLGSTLGQVPNFINYQAKLTDPDGIALEGSTGIKFSIYDSLTGGTALWSDSLVVNISHGLFDVILGPLPLPFNQPFWMELKVETETLVPRQSLTSVPYSIHSSTATTSDTSNAVEWANIFNLPPGFADNIDDTGHFEPNTIDTIIAYWDSLRNLPLGFADNIDDTGHFEPNIIDTFIAYWGSIRNIPAGFADGIDHTNDLDVNRLRSNTNPWLQGDIALQQGANVTLTQSNDTITISASSSVPADNVTGTGYNNKLAIWDGARTLTYSNDLHWDEANTRLGIGTDSPNYTLDVDGMIAVTSDASLNGIWFKNTGYRMGDIIYMSEPWFRLEDADNYRIFEVRGRDDFFFDNVDVYPDDDNVQSLGRATNRWSALYSVDGYFGGNVGIGTTSPKTALEVNGYIAMHTTMIRNCGFESGLYTGWTIVAGGVRTPGVYQDYTYAPEGKYMFGYPGDHTSSYGGSNRLVWGIEQDIPNSHVITEASRFRFYTYAGSDSRYHHWHVKITYTDATSTTIDNYPFEGGDSDWLATHGIPTGQKLYLVELNARGATMGKIIDKISIEIHKCHTGYTRYPPEVYIDGISLFYE